MMSARLYHEAVIHRRGRLSGLGLDWANQPTTFKSYPDLPHIALSREVDLPDATLWEVQAEPSRAQSVGLDILAAVLFHAAGLTRSAKGRGGEFFYRACPSAGALYPCEVYLAWPGSAELASGIFHYDVSRHGLTVLRNGCPEAAALGLPDRSRAPSEAIVFITAIFFRSAWKYRARAYRYLNLDAGHLAEGLALGLAAHGVTHCLETDFDDAAVAGLLGLDPDREGCLCAVRFASGFKQCPDPLGGLPPDAAEPSRTAARDASPLEVMAVHASCSGIPSETAAVPGPCRSRLGSGLPWRPLPKPQEPAETLPLFEAMQQRKSRRSFVPGAAPKGAAGRVLASLGPPLYPLAGHPAEEACGVGVLTGEQSFAGAGFSLLDRRGAAYGLLRDGNLLPPMAAVCLDQLWLGNAAMHVLFLLDFVELEPCMGARGYRAALQAAGRLGHRLYLAAESLGLGACGAGAFYDEEAAELLGLPPGAALAYVLAVGPAKG